MNKRSTKRHKPVDDATAGIATPTDHTNCPVIIVGIGISAGGLDSLKRFFSEMPSGHGVAFVLILRQEPPYQNTRKLVGDQTAFTVVEATEGMPVLADRVHIIPPDKFLNITQCRLTLQEPVQCKGMWMPVDHFFCSLASDQQRRACGVVLSGAGSDGTVGLSEIKAAGGKTLAEDPGSAMYPNMPQSAIDAGVADAVLPAEAMAEVIVRLAEQVAADTRGFTESAEFDASLRDILDILRARAGHDFRCYKSNTLVRRILRRMSLGKIKTFADYARFLQDNPREVDLLQRDLFIGVTEFFRQPHAWEMLEEKVIIPLVENARPGSEIRVWVPGCSTGKEAYSLAMLMIEQVENSGKKVDTQIFATDADSTALSTARSAIYSEEEIGNNVSPGRLKRFFTRRDGRFQVIKNVRDQIVFAPQNLTSDPPFSKLDLISCRNLLIYLDQQVQKKLIDLFHFALRERGFLFLGTAETIGDREDLFEPVSKKWRIYRRIGTGRRIGLEIPVYRAGESRLETGIPAAAPAPRTSLASVAHQVLLERFAPACVMIDRKLRVLYIHGAIEDYLTFPTGELTTRVVDMAREGLRARLRGMISKCIETNRSVSVTARVRRGKKSVPVKATATPLRHPGEAEGLLLITFEDYRIPVGKSHGRTAGLGVRELEDELKVTREELQSTIEQLESSNAQLKAANEEVTTTNEELQSANEELETSKEELQVLNEELYTINARLQEKVEELESANNDMVNLLSSTAIATMFLSKELKIKWYTPAITHLFCLIPSDVGRYVGDVRRKFSDETLLEDACQVLEELTPVAKEVHADDDQWYIRRITPYRTNDDRIEGVVITFLDITEHKRAEVKLQKAHEQAAWLATFPKENPNLVLRVSGDGLVLYANPAALSLPEWLLEVNRPVPSPMLELAGQALAGAQEMQCEVAVSDRVYWLSFAPIVAERYVNIYGRDITKRKQAEEALRRLNAELERRVAEQTVEIRKTYDAVKKERQRFYDVLETLPVYVVLLTPDHHVPFANRFFRERFGESQGKRCYEYLFGRTEPCEICETYKVLETNAPHRWEWTGPDGRNYDIYDFPFTDTDGSTLILEMGIDITEVKRAEAALKEVNETLERRIAERTESLRENEERFRIAAECSSDLIWEWDIVKGTLTWFGKIDEMLGYTPGEFPRTIEVWEQVIHPDDHDRVMEVLDRHLKKEELYYAEYRVRKKDGSFCNWTDQGIAFRDEQGTPYKMIGACSDITARKQAEELLRKAKNELEIRVKERTAELQHINEQLIEENQERMRTEQSLRLEEARLDVLLRLSQLSEDPLDKITGFTLEQAITLTHSKIGFVGFLSEDETTYTLHSVSKDVVKECNVAGNPVHWPVSDAGIWADAIRERRTLFVNDYSQPHPRKKGIPLGHVSMERFMVVPVFEGGRIVTIAGVGNKTSDYNKSDERQLVLLLSGMWSCVQKNRSREELKKAYDELEEKVEQRTAELAASTAALKQANAAKDQFMAALSHELRTPLTPILAATDSLLDNPNLTQPVREDLEIIQRNIALEVQLIDDLLDVMRIDKGKLTLDKRPVDVAAILRDVSLICASDLKTKNQTLTLEMPDVLSPVLGDSTRLHQVFWNLLKNAIKFTPPGGRIGITSSLKAGDHPSLLVKVSDSGMGIDPKDLNRIFFPFEQGGSKEKGLSSGLGLGLSICRAVVEVHGGRISAFSEGEGRGSTFAVELPIMDTSKATEEKIMSAVPTEGMPSDLKLRILLVEDHAEMAALVARELKRKGGHTVRTAGSVKEALAAVESSEFDILISDVGLPDGTGEDLMRELIARGKAIRGIALSGYCMPQDIQSSLDAGFVEHLAKPISIRVLLEALQRVASRE